MVMINRLQKWCLGKKRKRTTKQQHETEAGVHKTDWARSRVTDLQLVVHVQVDGLDLLDLRPQPHNGVLLLVRVPLQEPQGHLHLRLHADLQLQLLLDVLKHRRTTALGVRDTKGVHTTRFSGGRVMVPPRLHSSGAV